MAELVIPSKLAATVVRWEGDGGRRWLERLPQLVEELADEWDLEVGEPFDPGGNISWVAPVRCRADGLQAVLKLQHPHPESEPEAAGLRAWAGHGAVELHEHDTARCALLIERCRPGTALVAEGGSDGAVAAGAALGARLHTAPVPRGLPTLASVLDGWADELEARLDEPIGDPALGELALATMRTRPRACRNVVLLHGDLNPTNVLAADREPWLAIDPKPMSGDPAYDAPRLVTQPDPSATADPAATLARRLDVVSAEMGVERHAVVAWCLVDAIEMSGSARAHGDPEGAERAAGRATLITPHLS